MNRIGKHGKQEKKDSRKTKQEGLESFILHNQKETWQMKKKKAKN